MNSFVSFMHVFKSFGEQEVLKDITLRFVSKGLIGIKGPSGCGKSTLMKLLAGMDTDYRGDILIHNSSLKKMEMEKRSAFRMKRIGFLFQKDSLLEVESALENVMLPRRAVCDEPKYLSKQKGKSLLFLVGLEHKANQVVSKMSGGERQRVALARALANDPAILICDEPTAALDASNSVEVFSMLRRIAKNRLVFVVSHDEEMLARFADRLISLKDGRVIDDSRLLQREIKGYNPPRLEKKKDTPRLPIGFCFHHASKRRKIKRLRGFLSEGAITIGLIGFGLSMYVSSSLGRQIQTVFSALIPENSIVASPKQASTGIDEVQIASFIEVNETANEDEGISGVGKTFVYDFENNFPHENEFIYTLGSKLQIVNGLSLRSINDFLWLENANKIYPSKPQNLDWSEMVLGLPYGDMARICADFGLSRGYEHLGRYAGNGRFLLTLRLANLDYGLSEEMPFSVVGITETDRPILFHSSLSWNKEVLVDHFRFIDVGGDIPTSPQETQSIPFIELATERFAWLKKERSDPRWNGFLFDVPSPFYMPTLLADSKDALTPNRLYVYSGKKTGISYDKIEETLLTNKDIAGALPITSIGYWADASSNLMGFSSRFFVCKNKELAFEMSEEYSNLPIEVASLVGEMPDGVKEASVLSMASGGLRLSTDFSKISGIPPASNRECALSSSLFEKWGKPNSIEIAAEVASMESGAFYSRDFKLVSMEVTGVIENPLDTLYVQSNWTVDFYLDPCGVSPMLLEPTGVVFQFKEGTDVKKLTDRLSMLFPKYDIGCPSENVKESLRETIGYLEVVLALFSSISLTISGLLFLLVVSLSIAESAKEAELFFCLGVSKKDVARIYRLGVFQYAFSGLFAASLSIVAAEIGVSIFLSAEFASPLVLRVSFSPILLMAAVALLLGGIIGGIATIWAKKN